MQINDNQNNDAPNQPLPVKGLLLGTAAAGIGRKGRDDVALISVPAGAAVACVMTQNKARAAPVTVAERHLRVGSIQALVVNSGNANAGLGKQGENDCIEICGKVGELLKIPTEAVLPFSTGVIGRPMPVSRINDCLPGAQENFSEDNWNKFASAIMTTDTFPKAVSRTVSIAGGDITITGAAKGSGMIRPNMATMLAFVATDAELSANAVKRALTGAVASSFNRISVDGDTSTNDSCVLIATGKSGIRISQQLSNNSWQAFYDALSEVTAKLAELIVRDGEGASKYISVTVSGGWSDSDCLEVANTVANSPLVKTALYASDPNWGRIYAAVGRANIDQLDMSLINIKIGGVRCFAAGAMDPDYTEEHGVKALEGDDIDIEIELGLGTRSVTVWTCDLTPDYVRINADYRT